MSKTVTKTFISYEDYEPYEGQHMEREVASRDILDAGFRAVFGDDPVPRQFRFFDADVKQKNGKETVVSRCNFSKTYTMAERVMTLDDFKKEQLPRIAQMRKHKGGLLTRIFNLNRPVMAWYIDGVEATLKAAEAVAAAKGATVYIAETSKDAYYAVVTGDMIVIGKDMRQIYPAPPSAGHNGPRVA